jgi:hypothetical protein
MPFLLISEMLNFFVCVCVCVCVWFFFCFGNLRPGRFRGTNAYGGKQKFRFSKNCPDWVYSAGVLLNGSQGLCLRLNDDGCMRLTSHLHQQ